MIFLFLIPHEWQRPGFKATLVFLFLIFVIWLLAFPGWKTPLPKSIEVALGLAKQLSLAGVIVSIPLMLYQLLEIPCRRRIAVLALFILLWIVPGTILSSFIPADLTRLSILVVLPAALIYCCLLCLAACIQSFRLRRLDAIFLGIGIAAIALLCGYDILQALVPSLSLVDKWDIPIGRYGDLISLSSIGHFIFINALGLSLLQRYYENKRRVHRLSTEVISAETTERQRLSRELHDGIAQSLNTLQLQSELMRLDYEDNPDLHKKLGSIAIGVENAIDDLQQAATQMRPIWLENRSFSDAVDRFVADLRSRAEIDIEIDIEERIELREVEENHLFRMIQEAIQNAMKHGKCRRLTVTIKQESGRTCFRCADDGLGFSPEMIRSAAPFRTLRERTELLQGRCEIQSEIGQGTVVEIVFSN